MTAYYNEIDPHAAQWLRNLIDAGHIAPGIVDERSIEDVRPAELMGYTQCHFFAGIGVWSYALRAAGWPDDRPVWTGSCPCQPFSAAGQGAGFDDERHLWPAFFHLISQCRPPAIFGEQVAGPDADPWIDLVCDDLESLGDACGAVAFPSAGVGAPHIRDRLYWMAYANHERRAGQPILLRAEEGRRQPGGILKAAGGGSVDGMGNAGNQGLAQRVRLPGIPGGEARADQREATERAGVHAGILADTAASGRGEERADAGGFAVGDGAQGLAPGLGAGSRDRRPGPANGFWRDADWLACRDGKWRPVEPGTFPLAHGAPGRVGRLRAYGNAINAEQARIFIEAAMSQPA